MPDSRWSQQQLDELIDRLSHGEALVHIEQIDGMPSADSVGRWEDAGDEFAVRITRARAQGLDFIAAEARREAREATDAGLGRLKLDADRWYLSKLAPKKYGDKLDLTSAGERLNWGDRAAAAREHSA